MTQKAQQEVQDWTKRSRRWRLAAWVLLGGNTATVAWQLWHDPLCAWMGYWLAVTLALDGAALWLARTEQKRQAWGDKALAWWCWHWFTGAPLVLVDNGDLPWWRDIWACRPWLDTDRAAPCPAPELEEPAPEVPVSPEVAAHAAEQAQEALRLRRWCQARRVLTGAGRSAATCGLVLAEYVRSGAPDGLGPQALANWGLVGTAVLVGFVLLTAAETMQLAMWKWWVRPIALACADLADWPHSKRPRSWVKLSRLWEDGERRRWWHAGRLWETRQRGVELVLSPTFKAGDKTTEDNLLLRLYSKSGLSPASTQPVWDREGAHRSLMLVPRDQVPATVSFLDETVRGWWLEKATRNAPVLGSGPGWKLVQKSMTDDSPHWLVAGPTGSGKSELVHSVLCGLLYKNRDVKGTRAEVWDIKLKSHVPLERLQCVSYYRALAAIALRCIAVAGEARERGDQSVQHELATGKQLAFPPLYLVFEDTAQAVKQMQAARKVKLPGTEWTYGDAILAWDEILGLGRGVNVHAFACPHRPEMKALGTTVARDNFELVGLMCGHDAGSVRMVDPSLKFEPLGWHPGRCRLLHGSSSTVFQSVWDEAGEMVGLLGEHYGLRELADLGGLYGPRSAEVGAPEDGGWSPAGDVVGVPVPTDAGSGHGLVSGQPDAGGHMAAIRGVLGTMQGPFTGPAGGGVPGGAQPVGDVGSGLVSTGPEGQQPTDDGGGGHGSQPLVVGSDGHQDHAGTYGQLGHQRELDPSLEGHDDQNDHDQEHVGPRGPGGPTTTTTAGGGAHGPIITRVRMDGQGEIPGGEGCGGGGEDRKSVPAGADPRRSLGPQATADQLRHSSLRAPSPEGPGVMGPDAAASSTAPPPSGASLHPPTRPATTNQPSAPQTHPQSPSRSDVLTGRRGVTAGRAVRTGGDGPSRPGSDPVTLSEAWEAGRIGQGVTLGAVERARTRSREVVAQHVARAVEEGRTEEQGIEEAMEAGWWFPQVIGTRPARAGQVQEEYPDEFLWRWWNSRVRAAPDDGEWWVYWLVEGGLGGLRFGCTVKIGYTDDLERRCRELGRHYPGFDGIGGDIVHLERYSSKAAAMKRERTLHRVYKRCYRLVRLHDDPPVLPRTSLMCWPRGNGGGKGGRETFWVEDVLAVDMARHCPRRRSVLQPPAEAVSA